MVYIASVKRVVFVVVNVLIIIITIIITIIIIFIIIMIIKSSSAGDGSTHLSFGEYGGGGGGKPVHCCVLRTLRILALAKTVEMCVETSHATQHC